MASFSLYGHSTAAQTLSNGEYGFVGPIGALDVTGGTAVTMSGNSQLTIAGSVTSQAVSQGGSAVFGANVGSAFITVGDGGMIASATHFGINLSGTTSLKVVNHGTITGWESGIYLSDAVSGNAANIEIINTGDISGTNYFGVEIYGQDGRIRLVNSGTISSSLEAVTMQSTGGSIVLSNSGIIQAMAYDTNDVRAIWLTGGPATINNTGQIIGDILTGNFLDQFYNAGTIQGDINLGSGDDIIDLRGGTISGTVFGGTGLDTYYVSDSSVTIWESGQDRDEVYSTVDFALPELVERLQLIGAADINGTGNLENNVLIGNSGDNRLTGDAGNDTFYGGGGADTIYGGSGNDLFVVDGGDIILEAEGPDGGLDTVQSLTSFTLGEYFENLELYGGAVSGTGNAENNSITGNGYANTLNGGGGSDTLRGSAGDDTYITDGGDTLVEEFGLGTDTVRSSLTFVLAANFENLVLTGSAAINGTGTTGNNFVTGNAAGNVLNGAGGIDTITGGAGNDTFITDGGDSLIEGVSEGTDTVQSSVTFTLGANFENLTLTGAVAISGTGNSGANRLTGNNAANTLNGGGGADTMTGLAGDDVYVTDGGDTLVEAASGGNDRVDSSVSFTLGAEFERLTLTGTGSISGTGNTVANTIIGNTGANTLNGGLGNDTMTGGTGADSFVFNTALGASNVDRITDFSVTDDTFRIENAVFAGLANGVLAASAFVKNTSGTAADASDRIIYQSNTGKLFFDADGTGAAAKVQFATIGTNLALTSADFFVT